MGKSDLNENCSLTFLPNFRVDNTCAVNSGFTCTKVSAEHKFVKNDILDGVWHGAVGRS